MMEKEKLRKADIFSGSHHQPVRDMDHWPGLENAHERLLGRRPECLVRLAGHLPLFVGAMIVLLGALLIRTPLRPLAPP
jgi:hypothetical protein